MSKTLFWYIFKHLIWIFLTASGALAGMMSFGGLLRPLTRQGLGISEVGITVLNLMPVMCTYAFPVAALFATTLVYGRLASENELVAMRACGISHLSTARPAIALGCIVSLLSLWMLCYMVPASTLRVERVVTSNVARMLATSIERTHEFQMVKNGPTISAQGATVLPPDPNDPDRQTVVLNSPLIISPEDINTPEGRVRVPKDFHTARKATVYVRQIPATEEVEVTAMLDGGVSFPRNLVGGVAGGVESTQFGPQRMASPISEKPKFMDLKRLRGVWANPDTARRVRDVVGTIDELLQKRALFDQIEQQLRSGKVYVFGTSAGERHTLTAQNPSFRRRENEIIVTAAPGAVVRYESTRGSVPTLTVDAQQIVIRPTADDVTRTVDFQLTFDRAVARPGTSAEPVQWDKKKRPFSVVMTPELISLGQRTAARHQSDISLAPDLRKQLNRALLIVNNEVIGELNSRAAFAVSCFVLVLMGAALGMMFRSGHFLSAFAISVAPALLCILLTTTGQHTLENVPNPIPATWTNPLMFGIGMIWSGNVAVAILAFVLLFRLQKQ